MLTIHDTCKGFRENVQTNMENPKWQWNNVCLQLLWHVANNMSHTHFVFGVKYRVSQKKVSDKIFLGYYLLVLTTGQLTSMPARRRGLEPRSHDRPQLVHLCFCLSSWHCLWNSQSWSPRLLARQIWGDHPSRRPALHCQACQACSSQFKHRWRRCKRDSTLTIMSINADCLHVCLRLSAWITLFPLYHNC